MWWACMEATNWHISISGKDDVSYAYTTGQEKEVGIGR
jgi:hypothetical protein